MVALMAFALAVVLSTPVSKANECWLNKQGLKYEQDYDKDVIRGNSGVSTNNI